MCMSVTKDQAKILLTSEDTIVFKVVQISRGKIESLYMNFEYSTTKVMESEDFPKTIWTVENEFPVVGDENTHLWLDYGFHSFTTKDDALKLLSQSKRHQRVGGWYAGVGLHVAAFIVPEGSQYVEGWFNDSRNILSNKLKFVGIVS